MNVKKEESVMESALRLFAVLAAVGILSGASLVFVYKYAVPKIEVNVAQETGRAIKKVFGDDNVTLKEFGGKDLYKVFTSSGQEAGYAFLAEGNGYQGAIKIIGGIDPAGRSLKGIEILESSETPGLGAEIMGEKFRGQFKGLVMSQPIEYIKNSPPQKEYEIQAITGATISSRAVVNVINGKVEEVRTRVAGEAGGKEI